MASNCTSVSTALGRDSILGSSSTIENGCLRIKRADKENANSEQGYSKRISWGFNSNKKHESNKKARGFLYDPKVHQINILPMPTDEKLVLQSISAKEDVEDYIMTSLDQVFFGLEEPQTIPSSSCLRQIKSDQPKDSKIQLLDPRLPCDRFIPMRASNSIFEASAINLYDLKQIETQDEEMESYQTIFGAQSQFDVVMSQVGHNMRSTGLHEEIEV